MKKQKTTESPAKMQVIDPFDDAYIHAQAEARLAKKKQERKATESRIRAESKNSTDSDVSLEVQESVIKQIWRHPLGKVVIIAGGLWGLAYGSRFVFRTIGGTVEAFKEMRDQIGGRAA